jgi:uncharacterized protein
MKSYHILALDGGGVGGVLTATLLERLEQAHPGFLAQVDLFAGTSAGGLLALGLAAGRTPSQARQFYEEKACLVFSDHCLDDIRDLGKLLGADYSTGPVQAVLEAEFGDQRLGDLPGRVLVSAFDLESEAGAPGPQRAWKAKFYHNFPGPCSDSHERVVDVGLRTSAAPTFFPIYQGFVDGGVVANNPSMCAVAQALNRDTGGQELYNLVLLSIGTGLNPRSLPSQDGDWGLVQWGPHLVSLMLEGSVGLVDYQCKQILGARYLRLNPVLPGPIGLDRVDRMDVLTQTALDFDLSEALDWVREFFIL